MLELSALDLAPATGAKTKASRATEADSGFANALAQANEEEQKLGEMPQVRSVASKNKTDDQAGQETNVRPEEDEPVVIDDSEAEQALNENMETYAMAMLAAKPHEEEEKVGEYSTLAIEAIATEDSESGLDLDLENPEEGDGVPEEFAALLENVASLDLENLPLDKIQGMNVDMADFNRLIEGINIDQAAEPRVEPAMTRLQQAVGASFGGTLLEEATEVILPQVVRGLTAMARDAMSEMRLQLQPGDLGEIEMRVRAIEGVVRSEILVQHSEVKYLLESQVDRLRTALSEQGLEFAGLDVNLAQDGNPWSDTPFGQDHRGRNGDRNIAGDGTAEDVQDRTQILNPSGAKEVDYLA